MIIRIEVFLLRLGPFSFQYCDKGNCEPNSVIFNMDVQHNLTMLTNTETTDCQKVC